MAYEYHEPVLLQESIEYLDIQENGTYVDVTFGGGGHSRAILSRLGEGGKLFAFDRDPDAAERCAKDPFFLQAQKEGRFRLIRDNFRYLKNHLRFNRALPVNGILGDLGVSSHQFDVAERGFSIRSRGPLDMRMDQSGELTAAQILNTYDENRLSEIFRLYGEIPFAGRLAAEVVKARQDVEFEYTDQAVAFFSRFASKGRENKFLAMVFQSLRIEVNAELESLEELLRQSLDVLKTDGRLVIISYHSLEDRLVKNFTRSGNFQGEVEKDFYGNNLSPFEPVVRKAVVPTGVEIERNPRARSARMRVARRREM